MNIEEVKDLIRAEIADPKYSGMTTKEIAYELIKERPVEVESEPPFDAHEVIKALALSALSETAKGRLFDALETKDYKRLMLWALIFAPDQMPAIALLAGRKEMTTFSGESWALEHLAEGYEYDGQTLRGTVPAKLVAEILDETPLKEVT